MYQQYRTQKSGSESTGSMDLQAYVRKVLEQELSRSDSFLSEEDVQELLNEDYKDPGVRESIIGYPSRPLHRDLSHQLKQWIANKRCPIDDLQSFDLLDEKGYKEERSHRFVPIGEKLYSAATLWETWSEEERCSNLREILKTLGKRGLLDLLGLRKTEGTEDIWPPPRKCIEETFQQINRPESKSPLTVGAKALTKHCHRDQSNSWWGDVRGSEAQKNEHATQKLKEILDGATWLNIHKIVHGKVMLEVRQEEGYGVRWFIEEGDGLPFRGFLEPQMEDGHAVGWQH